MDTNIAREKVIELMVGFMADELYAGQDIPKEELINTAALYYDLVTTCNQAIIDASNEAAKIAEAGYVDASNADQVDLMGGPRAIDNSTMYKG